MDIERIRLLTAFCNETRLDQLEVGDVFLLLDTSVAVSPGPYTLETRPQAVDSDNNTWRWSVKCGPSDWFSIDPSQVRVRLVPSERNLVTLIVRLLQLSSVEAQQAVFKELQAELSRADAPTR